MFSARLLGVGLILASGLPYGFYVIAGSKMALFIASMLVLFGLAACIRIRANPDTLKGKRIFVTGCDTGIGLALCQRLVKHRAVVFAGCLSVRSDGPAALARDFPDNFIPLKVDVTSDADVNAALRLIDDHLGEDKFLWAVVNNAGVQVSGDVELTPMSQTRLVMEVNYFGLLRVTKAFLPLLREAPGRLINLSSIRGLCVWPFTGVYTSSKFAVEALTDSLRLELARFGVQVVLAEPSHFGGATGMLNDPGRIEREFEELWNAADEHVKEAYGKEYVDAVKAAVLSGSATSYPTIDPVVADLVEALASDAPRERYLTAGTNSQWVDKYKVQARLRDLLPTSLHDWLVDWSTVKGLRLPAAAAERARLMRRSWFQ